MLAHRLYNIWIVPYPASPEYGPHTIAHMWGYVSLMLLKGHLVCQLNFMLDHRSFTRSRSLCTNRCFHLSSSSLAHFCSDSGHLVRPWRSKAPRPILWCLGVGLFGSPGWVDHWWYLVGRSNLPNHCFSGYFYSTGTKIAQTNWYPWGTRT